jgi:hypothetical protein
MKFTFEEVVEAAISGNLELRSYSKFGTFGLCQDDGLYDAIVVALPISWGFERLCQPYISRLKMVSTNLKIQRPLVEGAGVDRE